MYIDTEGTFRPERMVAIAERWRHACSSNASLLPTLLALCSCRWLHLCSQWRCGPALQPPAQKLGSQMQHVQEIFSSQAVRKRRSQARAASPSAAGLMAENTCL